MNRRIQLKNYVALAAMAWVLWGCPATKVDYVGVEKSGDPGVSAVLNVPDYIEVRSVDNEVIEKFYTRVLYSGERQIHLPPGPHAVVLRYSDIWSIDQNDHEKIRSDYIGLSFTAVASGIYRIEINEPDDRAQAHKLADQFTAWIIDKRTGKKVSE